MRTTKPMSWRTLAIIAVAACLVGAGCGDSTKPNVFDPPGGLKVVNGDRSVALGWNASPDAGGAEFKEYAVFRGTTSLVGISASQLPGFRIGTASKGTATYTDALDANGIRYYYHLRSVKTDGSFSEASNEVMGAGRDEGTGEIIQEFASTGDSGFDFSAGNTVSLSESNSDRFTQTDVYLGTTATDDASTAPLALKSPELLSRLGNPEWNSRNTDIKSIGTDYDITTTETPGAGWANTQNVVEGTVYAIKTPSDNYAKIKILDIEGLAGGRRITFKYAYQTTPNLVLF